MADITVCAAILRDDDGNILICRRGAGGSCAYLWEFPGGKLEAGESPQHCTIRECREELDVEIQLERLFAEKDYQYPDKAIHFYFFLGKIVRGTVQRLVHSELEWVQPERLTEYSFCPADIDIVKELQRIFADNKIS